ncbi:3-isopropylmalate dehydratase [Lecanora helva]
MPTAIKGPQTLYDKVLNAHIVDEKPDGTLLLYIDRHLIHEVTTPQAFEGLRNAGRGVRRPDCTLATTDHNVPTAPRKNFKNVEQFVEEEDSRLQCMTLEENVKAHGLTYFGLGDKRQGIVHIIGPEQGDSHTATHGAFGALAFGIGTSEVEHVLATQTLITKRSKNMRVKVEGQLAPGVSSKDIILHVIGQIGTAGGTGAVIEYCGSAIEGLSMEGRMSICNMSIEGGARAGMIAPDATAIEYLKGSPEWRKATKYWATLKSDPGAKYDMDILINAADIVPTVSWGTSPQDVVPITGAVPGPGDFDTKAKQDSCRKALEYMGLEAGTKMEDIVLDKIFIGSCTNARIEDLRAAAKIVEGKKIAPNLKRAMIVPGSGLVKEQAESEKLDRIFIDAGFEWREAGCSMCLGMNPDILSPMERCASTSNRNFEGRQGARGRTHLMSPVMAAAAALTGKLTDVRKVTDWNTTPAKASPKLDMSADVAEIESDEDIEQIGDYPEDGQQTGVEDSKRPSVGMPPFTKLRGIAAPLEISNVDTDAIIPKQFLKTIKRTGLGSALFWPLRYNHEDGSNKPDFVLNTKPYDQAKILVVTGPNFGCGSSREHAPWALLDFGIKAIIAPSYADIFFNNTFKNGMLPIIIPEQAILETIANDARAGREIEVDLPAQEIKNDKGDVLATFDVEEFRKHCLVNGLDDIGLTMQLEDRIREYEKRMAVETPWIGDSGYLKRRRRDGPVKPEKKQPSEAFSGPHLALLEAGEHGFLPLDKARDICQHYRFEPYATRDRLRKVYDLFLINTELDFLEIRLHELDSEVDYFVILESTTTFQMDPKPLYLQEKLSQFAAFQHKIIHRVIDPSAVANLPKDDTWEQERYTRNALFDSVLLSLTGPQAPNQGDVLLIGDIDEIPRLSILTTLRNCAFPPRVTLRTQMYYYSYQWLHRGALWHHPQATYYNGPENTVKPESLRTGGDPDVELYMAGWHCSSCFGNMQELKNKIRSFSHRGYNQAYFLEEGRLVEKVRRGEDLFEREGEVFDRVEGNVDVPGVLREEGSRRRFAYMLDRDTGDANFRDL